MISAFVGLSITLTKYMVQNAKFKVTCLAGLPLSVYALALSEEMTLIILYCNTQAMRKTLRNISVG
jgi:hypothetical protein